MCGIILDKAKMKNHIVQAMFSSNIYLDAIIIILIEQRMDLCRKIKFSGAKVSEFYQASFFIPL